MTGDSMTGGSPVGSGGMGLSRFSVDQPFDAQFIDQMSIHHQGVIASTQAMIADSSRPELRALARNIITTQRAQLAQMKTWRNQWYPGLADIVTMRGSGHDEPADDDADRRRDDGAGEHDGQGGR